MSKHAVALRDFTHDERRYSKGDLIKGLPSNQFADWERVELVRAATDKDLGTPAPPAAVRARSKRKAKSAPAPAAAPAPDTVAEASPAPAPLQA